MGEPRAKPTVFGVIPTRLGSARFPRKALADETGLPMVVHVLRQASRCRRLDRVLVAAPEEDLDLLEAVRRHGGEIVATRSDHPNGTSRIAEAMATLDPEGDPDSIVVNVQGDEPLIDPAHIDLAVERLEGDPNAGMSTLVCPFSPEEDAADPNVVKAVVAASGRALYFSRAAVPGMRSGDPAPPRLRHLGLYAYRRATLDRLATLPESPLERIERLEQLRALEHGIPIVVGEVDRAEGGIDTPEQYAAFVARWRSIGTG
ncbi:MAG: 3-deoxy-manno-octulosonate cytidylyltransferase [Planctomycetota bacterium]|jgi:3-deoxy-manno-octulosonate cytidylyltransferase (CMP-KDO synthetase)